MSGTRGRAESPAHVENSCPILRVRDLEASKEYYSRVLGFRLDWEEPGVMAGVSRDRGGLMLCHDDQGHAGTWAWLGTGDVDALFAELTVRGATIRLPPTNYPWAYEIHVEDPDGHVLRFGGEPKRDRPFSPWVFWYRQDADAPGIGRQPGTRRHVHEETFPADPCVLFALLHTPSAIRGWWGASRVVVLPEAGGTWAATWGEPEDDPDYVTAATIGVFDQPRRMVLTDYRYRAKSGSLPFHADFTTEFLVTPAPEGGTLRVTQDGFPAGAEADGFYAACGEGWRATFAGIRRFLGSQPGGSDV